MKFFIYDFYTEQVAEFNLFLDAAKHLAAEVAKVDGAKPRIEHAKSAIMRGCDSNKVGKPIAVYKRWWCIQSEVFPEVDRQLFLDAMFNGNVSPVLINQITGQRLETSADIKKYIAEELKDTYAYFKFSVYAGVGYAPYDGHYYQYPADPLPVPVMDVKKNRIVRKWCIAQPYKTDRATFLFRLKLGKVSKPNLDG